jgi:hypothetical protein
LSQRDSGYERKERDLYETPEWVTRALLPHLPRRPTLIWEPACGGGKMTKVFSEAGLGWGGSDIEQGDDFLAEEVGPGWDEPPDSIITNPPYDLAPEFCEHALRHMEPVSGFVAMLLRTDFDHAKTRSHLFRDCPAFAKKVVLMKRIVWFTEANGKPKASPSYNHCWMIWDWKHEGAPTLAYGP